MMCKPREAPLAEARGGTSALIRVLVFGKGIYSIRFNSKVVLIRIERLIDYKGDYFV
jgi:hypothetical protein